MKTYIATELKTIDGAELSHVEGGSDSKFVMIPTDGTLQLFAEAGIDKSYLGNPNPPQRF